ncbi:M67 family metallopeptidase [Cohnella hashimotonis]|uniref:M67 family metallopeptidase n=1 Tax=Cohnella hashimotonis TaxID=2826895 RepID=A0ABT6TDM4_9BACL|nr:M67 family metallopeptidase [Cohnella hashimotonis]MDI4644931.1 M67 family metallopeptidase [Cohnella hashimotonis]
MMPKAVHMTETLLHTLVDGCRQTLPLEACGILLGASQETMIAVSDILFIPNAAADPAYTFAFEPSAWIEAVYAAQKSRQKVVGFFHSHPAGPPLPSDRDLRGWDGFGCHLIVSLQPSAETLAYEQNDEGTWTPIRLCIR